MNQPNSPLLHINKSNPVEYAPRRGRRRRADEPLHERTPFAAPAPRDTHTPLLSVYVCVVIRFGGGVVWISRSRQAAQALQTSTARLHSSRFARWRRGQEGRLGLVVAGGQARQIAAMHTVSRRRVRRTGRPASRLGLCAHTPLVSVVSVVGGVRALSSVASRRAPPSPNRTLASLAPFPPVRLDQPPPPNPTQLNQPQQPPQKKDATMARGALAAGLLALSCPATAFLYVWHTRPHTQS